MPSFPNEVELLRVSGWVNAESIVAALRGSGIPARAHGEAIGLIYGITLDGLGEVTIFVPEDRLEEARALLSAAAQGELEPGSDQPAGETQSDDE